MAAQRVLIVEDDPHFGAQLVDLFSFQGYDVELQRSGAGAVESYTDRSASVVIVDLVLPGLGGVDVVRKLRSLPQGTDVPIILMSAVYRDPRMFERELRQLGVLEFLPKPFSPIDLGRKVDALLGGALPLDEMEARVTATGSWRLEELQEVLGEGPTQLGTSAGFDRRILLDLFVDIFRRHAAGRLTLRNDHAQRDIFFLNGYPVAAESGDEADSLASVLQRLKLLSADQVDQALRKARAEGRSLRDTVASSGLLPERKLKRAERARVRQIVVGSFRWSSGSSQFDPGEVLPDGLTIVEVNPVTCLYQAVERHLAVDELAPDIRALHDQVLSKGSRYPRLVSYVPLPPGLEGLLDFFEGDRLVSDVVQHFSAHSDALVRALWLMFSLGIVEGVAPGAAAVTSAIATTDPGGLGRVSVDAPSPLDAGAEPADPAFVEKEHRLRMDLDYYSFLDVGRDAPLEEIQRSWENLAQRYAVQSTDEETDRWLRELRARLQVSYKTLADPGERKQYDQRLAVLDTGEWTWPGLAD